MSRSLPIREQRDTKFLLNSWALLVTIGSDFHQSQALSRSYSSNWPNSLNYHTSMAIGYSPRRPDAVIGTDTISSVRIQYYSSPLFKDQSNSPWYRQVCTLPKTQLCAPVDLLPSCDAWSDRKEIPAIRYQIDG